MRRFGSFVVLALVTALGCKSNVVPIQSGAYLNIYAEADGGPITGQSFNFPTACQGFPVSHEFFIENDFARAGYHRQRQHQLQQRLYAGTADHPYEHQRGRGNHLDPGGAVQPRQSGAATHSDVDRS